MAGNPAAQYPDDVLVPVPLPHEFAVRCCIGFVKDQRARAGVQRVDLVAPGGQQADVQAQLVGFTDDQVDVLEVLLVRPRGVEVVQRQVAVRVGRAQAVVLGQDYGLNDGEALPGARG